MMDYLESHGGGERLLLITSCHCRKPGGPWAAITVSYAETNCYLKSLFTCLLDVECTSTPLFKTSKFYDLFFNEY